MTDRAPTALPEKRGVMVSLDYLDGIQAATVHEPAEWERTMREIDIAILDAYDAAWNAIRQAEKALLAAYAVAPEIPNPLYDASYGEADRG